MKTFVITLTLVLSLAIAPAPALAQTNTGPTPGSFWYGITTTFENVNLFFTFNNEKKAEKALTYAERRLTQAKAAAENENTGATEIALADYEEKLTLATESSKKIDNDERAEKLLTSIADNTAKHQEVLSEVLEKVPEEARKAIAKAIEASKRGQEEATKQITELKSEVERLKKEVEGLKKESSNTQVDEVEKLKKEVEELKAKDEKREQKIEELSKQKTEKAVIQPKAKTVAPQAQTAPTRKTESSATQLKNVGENYAPTLAIPYRKILENLKKFNSDAAIYLVEFKDRKEYLQGHINFTEKMVTDYQNGTDDVSKYIRKSFTLFRGAYINEYQYIVQLIDYMQKSINVLSGHQSEILSIIASLEDPKNYMGFDEFGDQLEIYQQNGRDDVIYDTALEIDKAMRNYAKNVLVNEDGYKQILDKISTGLDNLESQSTSVDYGKYLNPSSQTGLTPSNQKYIERAERILNPVRCQTIGDISGYSYTSYITCY